MRGDIDIFKFMHWKYIKSVLSCAFFARNRRRRLFIYIYLVLTSFSKLYLNHGVVSIWSDGAIRSSSGHDETVWKAFDLHDRVRRIQRRRWCWWWLRSTSFICVCTFEITARSLWQPMISIYIYAHEEEHKNGAVDWMNTHTWVMWVGTTCGADTFASGIFSSRHDRFWSTGPEGHHNWTISTSRSSWVCLLLSLLSLSLS